MNETATVTITMANCEVPRRRNGRKTRRLIARDSSMPAAPPAAIASHMFQPRLTRAR